MNTKILVYICKGEFKDFEQGQKPLKRVKRPLPLHPRVKTKMQTHGWYENDAGAGDDYIVSNDLSNGYCFFVPNEDIFNDKRINIIEKVRDSLKEDIQDDTSSLEKLDAYIRNALIDYLSIVRSIIFDYFIDNNSEKDYTVHVITHWGGGTPTTIDNEEAKINSVMESIHKEECYANWFLLSASETYRPNLFSEEYSTVEARKKKKNGIENWKAKLPDANECKGILERYAKKEFKCVNWEECDPKKLYDDIMEHLTH